MLGVGSNTGLKKGYISFEFDHSIAIDSVKLELSYTMTGELPAEDITNKLGVLLNISSDRKKVSVDFTKILQNDGSSIIYQWRTVDLMVAVPTTLDTEIIRGKFNLQYPEVNWTSNIIGRFSPKKQIPNLSYFKGSDVTVYDSAPYFPPESGVHYYINDILSDEKFTIVDLDGYPTHGVK